MDNPNDARARAEAKFKNREDRAREGAEATTEYEAAAIAVREKTARLRALRLTRDAMTVGKAAKVNKIKKTALRHLRPTA